jgi:hypothetical protein
MKSQEDRKSNGKMESKGELGIVQEKRCKFGEEICHAPVKTSPKMLPIINVINWSYEEVKI